MAIPQPSSTFDDAALAPQDGDGVAVVQLLVAPDRKVEDCRIIASALSEADNGRVCNTLRGKRAAKAAIGPDGQAAYGTLTHIVAGSSASGRAAPDLPADIELDVASLPGGVRSKSVRLNVLLDESGKVASCEAVDGSAGIFAKTACSSLGGQAIEVRKDSEGKPVRYVDLIKVDFVTRQAAL